jgi:hypothetical protein
MPGKRINEAKWREILNRLVLRPRLKEAARMSGIDPSSLFLKLKQSVADPAAHQLTWLGTRTDFASHVHLARKMALVELDRSALTLALDGHSQPRYHDGKLVYVTDLQIASDAITLDDFDWYEKYGSRNREDVWARDSEGRLMPDMVTSPPNAQLVAKILSSLIPAYQEQSTVEHHHSGSVWVVGQTPQAQLPAGSRDSGSLGDAFGIAAPQADAPKPTNLLALPRPAVDTAEFDAKWLNKKLLRPVVLFRNERGRLLPPLNDDVVIAGSVQHRAFQDADIPVEAVRAETLLDEGYQNDFLNELAPNWKPDLSRPPTPAPPTESERVRAVAAQEKSARVPEASIRLDHSRDDKPHSPPPGGFRVLR